MAAIANVVIRVAGIRLTGTSRKIIGSATSTLIRDAADANTNITIADGGNVTARSGTTWALAAVTATGVTVASTSAFVGSLQLGNNASFVQAYYTGTSIAFSIGAVTSNDQFVVGSLTGDAVYRHDSGRMVFARSSGTIDGYISTASVLTWNFGISATTGTFSSNVSLTSNDTYFGFVANNIKFNNSTDTVTITSGGSTANAVVMDQGAGDNAILQFRSSDVTHGVTSLTDTTTFGYFVKANATLGGVALIGLSEDINGVNISGVGTTEDATRGTTANGAIFLSASKKSGTGNAGLAADKNMVVIGNASVVRFILDSDGDSHQDVGTAWTNFDTHDDLTLMNRLAATVSRRNDPLRSNFARSLFQNRNELQRLKLVTFNRNGHHFVNMSRLAMLHHGAIRQVGESHATLRDVMVQMLTKNPHIIGRKKALAALAA